MSFIKKFLFSIKAQNSEDRHYEVSLEALSVHSKSSREAGEYGMSDVHPWRIFLDYRKDERNLSKLP